MSNRIQKLLFSEYSDFEDVVLVESPFAETSRQGKGIRQVQIGLTPTKLILATYYVEAVNELGDQGPRRGKDPDIESFELVSAYPVECVNLSVFRHRRRQTLKARFCNGKVVYYEIGGWHEKKMLWAVWCERIKFLSPYETGTSVSETSVASSSSGSSLYIVRSSLSVSKAGQPILWCQYSSSELQPKSQQGSWLDPHLYLGPAYFEKGVNFTCLPETGRKRIPCRSGKTTRSRFSQKEMLVLSAEHEMIAQEAVVLWESQRPLFRRIRRRHGLCPFPDLLGGLGVWHLSKAQAFSLQIKKSVSVVDLSHCETPRPSLPRPQLVRTVSLEALVMPAICPDKLFQLADNRARQKKLEFWTSDGATGYRWRRSQYRAQQRHLRTLRRRLSTSGLSTLGMRRKSCRTVRSKESKDGPQTSRAESGAESQPSGDPCKTRSSLTVAAPGTPDWHGTDDRKKLTTSSLSHQLTMIEQQLFLQIDTLELGRLRQDQSSSRAAHLSTLMRFSHRMSSLVATQIVSGCTVKERGLEIVKYIGVAYKCHKLHNLQSAESVLHGLQCPAVYRLQHSWGYVRRHHASKYRRFEDLTKRYYDPRLPLYEKTYDSLSRTPPFLPGVSLLAAVLLGRLPELPKVKSPKFSSDCCRTSDVADSRVPKSLRRFLSAFNICPPSVLQSQISFGQPGSCHSDTHLHALSRETLLENLDKFFAPVSSRCPTRKLLQDIDYFLETNQAAARRYAIPTNPRARDFLLHAKYDDMDTLFFNSKRIEP